MLIKKNGCQILAAVLFMCLLFFLFSGRHWVFLNIASLFFMFSRLFISLGYAKRNNDAFAERRLINILLTLPDVIKKHLRIHNGHRCARVVRKVFAKYALAHVRGLRVHYFVGFYAILV